MLAGYNSVRDIDDWIQLKGDFRVYINLVSSYVFALKTI